MTSSNPRRLPHFDRPLLRLLVTLVVLVAVVGCNATPPPPSPTVSPNAASPTPANVTPTAAATNTPSSVSPTPNATPSTAPSPTPPTSAATPTNTASVGWQRVGPAIELRTVEVSPNGQTVLAGGAGLIRSTDGGATWQTFHSQIEIHDLAIDPTRRAAIYVGATRGCQSGLTLPAYRSDDGGQTMLPIGENLVSFAPHPNEPGHVYAAACRFVESTDAGATWREVPGASDPNFDAAQIALSPANPRLIYAVGASEGGTASIRVSDDGGVTWRDASPKFPDGSLPFAPVGIVVAPDDASVAFLATWDGVWATSDAGSTWTLGNAGLEPARSSDGMEQYVRLTSLAIAPGNAGVVYVGTGWERSDTQRASVPTGVGVFHSRDGGKTWAPLAAGLDGKLVRDLAISPDGEVLFAATNDGLYRLVIDQ